MRWFEAAVVRAPHVALGLALAFAGAVVAQEWRGPEELEVRVEDAKGRPLAGAEVVLDYATRELGGPAPLLTDAKGRIAIGGLAPGRWALEVRKPGFMSFRAEIALAGGEKPELVIASQHNVPGAVSTLRVRLGRARNAPHAPARVERVAAFAPPPAAAPAPVVPPAPAAPVAAPSVAPTPSTPAPTAQPAPPEAARTAAAEAPVRSPAPPSPAPVAPAAALPSPTAPAKAAATAVPPAAAAPPVSAPPIAAPPPAAAPPVAAVAPPARLFAAAPMARACYECRPGESALLAEAELAAGGAACPSDLASRLVELPLGELPALAAALPGGCALLAVELPATARYAGFRYEAAGGNGRSEDCLAGRPCPAGGCRFAGEPVVRREGDKTVVLALFESTAARRAGLTVYWRRTR